MQSAWLIRLTFEEEEKRKRWENSPLYLTFQIRNVELSYINNCPIGNTEFSRKKRQDKAFHNIFSSIIGPVIMPHISPPVLTCVSVTAPHQMWAAPLWLAGITGPGPPQHPSQHPPAMIGWVSSRDRIPASHWSSASPVQLHLTSHWSRTSHRILLSSFRTSFIFSY